MSRGTLSSSFDWLSHCQGTYQQFEVCHYAASESQKNPGGSANCRRSGRTGFDKLERQFWLLCCLLNVGGATYNKEKIGFVATQAANYASTLPADAARQGLVTDLVDQLLASMGFGSSTTVSIADLTVGTRQAVKVTSLGLASYFDVFKFCQCDALANSNV